MGGLSRSGAGAVVPEGNGRPALLLFHHALGLTPGLRAFADEVRAAGHRVVLPDLFDGARFESVEEGVAHAQSIGFDGIIERGCAAAEGLGDALVVGGFSLGVMPAQKLAQTRPGVLGALLYHGAVPSAAFGDRWPEGVGLQIHISEQDPWAEEDLPAAEALVAEAGGELFLYPGSGHLIADASSADHEPLQAALIRDRTLAFLEALRA